MEQILVIEDDIQIQNFMLYALETAGFSVQGTANGKEGLALALRGDINLVLLDLGLPDMDGMDVLRRLRENSDIPVIIVSARDQDKEKVTALDEGADDYLTKPFSATELMARIRVALRHYNKMIGKEKKEEPMPEPTVKICPYCYSEIPYKATKCAHCTSDLEKIELPFGASIEQEISITEKQVKDYINKGDESL